MLHISHGNLVRNALDRVALAGAGQMHADQLEQVVGRRCRPAEIVQLVGVKLHVDHAQQTAIGVDHRKREEAVQHEELARIEHRRAGGNGDDLAKHDVVHPRLGRTQQQRLRRE